MRVWLVEDKGSGSNLEMLLRRLEQQPETDLRLVGAMSFQPEYAVALRKMAPELVDVLVINEAAWPEGAEIQEVLGLGLGLVVVTSAERAERFRPLALQHPITFASHPRDPEALCMALVTAMADHRRDVVWQVKA